MPIGTPRSATPNRGVYSTSQTGLTPGDMFSICVDDDADEYGNNLCENDETQRDTERTLYLLPDGLILDGLAEVAVNGLTATSLGNL